MEKAYVFGCGQFFKNKQIDISEKYNIVAVLDNNRIGEAVLDKGSSVPIMKPIDVTSGKSIPIILAVRNFYSVWQQLRDLGMDSSKILFPTFFSPYTEEEKLFNANGGDFQIENGDIWYVDANRKYLIDSAEMLDNLPKILERDRVDASFLTNQAPVSPLNRKFGFSRGTPIDRYYIENWLESNKKLICIHGTA